MSIGLLLKLKTHRGEGLLAIVEYKKKLKIRSSAIV